MSFFALKTVALLSMLLDHITYIWPVELVVTDLFFPGAPEPPAIVPVLGTLVSYLGRIAAPIFIFSIANGYRHTRSLKRYILRLLIFACLAEIPYFLLFGFHGNILFSLLAGLLTLALFQRGNQLRPGLGWIAAGAVIAVAEVLELAEGGGRFPLMILVFFLTDRWATGRKALLWLLLLPLTRYSFTWDVLTQAASGTLTLRWAKLWLLNVYGPFLGVALTFFYNGKKGHEFPGSRYLWYWFYPAHLLILAMLRV